MQLATRIDDEQGLLFKETAKKLGTTPADALRMFVCAFNNSKGFPYDVRLFADTNVEAFKTEEEATRFATDLAMETIYEPR